VGIPLKAPGFTWWRSRAPFWARRCSIRPNPCSSRRPSWSPTCRALQAGARVVAGMGDDAGHGRAGGRRGRQRHGLRRQAALERSDRCGRGRAHQCGAARGTDEAACRFELPAHDYSRWRPAQPERGPFRRGPDPRRHELRSFQLGGRHRSLAVQFAGGGGRRAGHRAYRFRSKPVAGRRDGAHEAPSPAPHARRICGAGRRGAAHGRFHPSCRQRAGVRPALAWDAAVWPRRNGTFRGTPSWATTRWRSVSGSGPEGVPPPPEPEEAEALEEASRGPEGERRLISGRFRVEEFRVPLLKGVIRPPSEPLIDVGEAVLDLSVHYLSEEGRGFCP